MEKIKQFCKDHKKGLIITGVTIGGVVVAAVILKKVNIKYLMSLRGKSIISWTPDNKFITLEEVKEILDLNANNASSFAIVKEGLDPSAYTCVLLNRDVITTKII